MSALHLLVTDCCPDCGSELRVRSRKDGSGSFIGCSDFPRCRFSADGGDQTIREENLLLRLELEELRALESFSASAPDKALRDLVAWAHPDRHPTGQLNATEVTARLNALRSELRS